MIGEGDFGVTNINLPGGKIKKGPLKIDTTRTKGLGKQMKGESDKQRGIRRARQVRKKRNTECLGRLVRVETFTRADHGKQMIDRSTRLDTQWY